MAINEALIAEFKHESNNTRKILERVPTDKLSWKPHEKSMTIGRLATHIAELPIWIDRAITESEFDFGSFVFKRETKESTEAILQLFEERKESAIKLLQSASDELLNSPYTMRRGEQILATIPKKVNIRNIGLNHIYHHRGQLSVFLRLLDVNVPGMYGPSADELSMG
ncbi:MAG TPA: DinB family protein [Parafilimonas sp.]|nr:DinB family protein [Parafilimonas sp.]